MKTLVTGGSGFLGRHVLEFLEADDLSRRTGFDVLDEDDCAMAGEYDVVVHLAAQLSKSPDAESDVFRTNIEGTVNVLRKMRKDSVFVFTSTKDVYGRFAANYKEVPETCPTLYAGQSALEWSKLIAERYVEYYANKLGFRACIFRLSTVYAPASEGNVPNFVTHFANSIDMGEPISLPGGGAPVRDLLHVDDLSRACQTFADSVIRHGLYNLGGGADNALSLSELVSRLEKVSGLQATLRPTDGGGPGPVPLNYISDLSRVRQELDWDPRIGLDEGLKTLFRNPTAEAGAVE